MRRLISTRYRPVGFNAYAATLHTEYNIRTVADGHDISALDLMVALYFYSSCR
jgi:hypothetical protein